MIESEISESLITAQGLLSQGGSEKKRNDQCLHVSLHFPDEETEACETLNKNHIAKEEVGPK